MAQLYGRHPEVAEVIQSRHEVAELLNKRTVESFRADTIHAPFTVLLHKSVVEIHDTRKRTFEHIIPDMQDLLNSIVLYRTIDNNRLRGPDIKFLRRCLGLRALEISRKMSISREHFSRCENENVPISSSLEILLRIFLLKKIASALGSGLFHRGISINSGLDMIFDIENSKKSPDDSKELILNLRRVAVGQEIRSQPGHGQHFAWVRVVDR